MPWIAPAALGAAGLVGSMYSANKQAGTANQALGMTQGQFKQTQQDLRPWYNAGQQALGQLDIGLGLGPNTGQPGYGSLMQPFGLQQFQASPAYQFNLQQGQQAIDKGAAARGMFYAPQTLQDLGKYQQGLASNEFQNAFQNYQQQQGNAFNRLFAQSGTGQNAAVQTGAFGANAANVGAGLVTDRGAAQAGGIMGGMNMALGGLGQGYNNYLQNQILQQMQQGNYGQFGFNPVTGLATGDASQR